MSTDSKEHLSQLMDGELGGDTGRFILRRLEVSGELRGTWARYHLIRDCMRYQDRGLAENALGERVRQAINGLESPRSQGNAGARRWLRPVAGFAVAATVALMAVIAVAPNLPIAGSDGAQQSANVERQPFTSPNILSSSPVSRPVNLSGEDGTPAGRMNSYILRHYQVAGTSGGSGFVSFVPIVATKSATSRPEESETQDTDKPAQENEPVRR